MKLRWSEQRYGDDGKREPEEGALASAMLYIRWYKDSHDEDGEYVFIGRVSRQQDVDYSKIIWETRRGIKTGTYPYTDRFEAHVAATMAVSGKTLLGDFASIEEAMSAVEGHAATWFANLAANFKQITR